MVHTATRMSYIYCASGRSTTDLAMLILMDMVAMDGLSQVCSVWLEELEVVFFSLNVVFLRKGTDLHQQCISAQDSGLTLGVTMRRGP